MTVIAPFQVSYTNRVPYITVSEFKAVPTGLDIANLVEEGTDAQQTTALQELILRASNEADDYCFGAWGTLAASVNTENGRIRMNRDGNFVINPRFWPVLAVEAFSVGVIPGDLQAVLLSTDNCWIEQQGFTITGSTGLPVSTFQGPLQFGSALPGNQQFAQWTYVNGWPHCFTSAIVQPGATSLTMTQATVGVYPGSPLTIWDPPHDEQIVVGESYEAGATSVPLTTPILYGHSAGVNVSATPYAVKEAVIHLVADRVKSRGSGGLTLTMEGLEGTPKGEEGESSEHIDFAMDALDPFRAVWQ